MNKNNWYNLIIPKVSEVKSILKNLIAPIKNTKGINGIYLWGSTASYYKNAAYRVKNIDIVYDTDCFSEDLLAIEKEILHTADIIILEDEGFDLLAFNFTKKIEEINKSGINQWALSSDQKLLHWGPICSTIDDSQAIKEEAEKYAIKQTKIKNLEKTSNKNRNNWYQFYEEYINKYFNNVPMGWYQSEETNIKNILNNIIKI